MMESREKKRETAREREKLREDAVNGDLGV